MRINPDLEYRRQFIATSIKTDTFPSWDYTEINEQSLYIYSHHELEVTAVSSPNKEISLALLGFVIDPNYPNKKNRDIIKELVSFGPSIDKIVREISNLAGRYIFIICIDKRKYVINDMCGLRTVYYSIANDQFFIASNPAILKKVIELKPSENYRIFTESDHFKNDIEYWLPSGLTLYENVEQLVPNHYLNLKMNKQIRYWPHTKIKVQNLEDATHKTTGMLENLILSAGNRFQLALPLTAGWDSRVLLSASKKMINDIFVYTLQYRWLIDSSPDIKIPRYILKRFDIPYNKLDCRKELNPAFTKTYKSNVDLAHDDWMTITNGMMDHYPQKRVVLRGNVSEIARNCFYSEGHQGEITSANQLLFDWQEWSKIPFILDYLNCWIKNTKNISKENNLDILDLWYMEIFMGGWQAQGQLEWDIIHEEFTPYNYRPLIETMLGVPIKYRLHDKPRLYQEIIQQTWPELLYWPFNPPSWNKRHQLKYYMADKLKKVGLYNIGLKLYHIIHPLYLRIKGIKN